MCPLKAISSFYTTLLSNQIGIISEPVSSMVLASQRQISKKREGNRFCRPTQWQTLDFPGNRQHAPKNSWEAELILQSKEIKYNTPAPVLSAWLVNLRNCLLEVYLVLKAVFFTLGKFLGKYPLGKLISSATLLKSF